MPPINQQGSRAGLVTGLVAFVILFVTSTIFAFQFYGKWKDADASRTALQKQYNEVISPNNLSSAPVADLQAVRSDPLNKFGAGPNDSALDVAIAQRNVLAADISGAASPTASVAADSAATGLKNAQASLDAAGVRLQLGKGLVPAIDSLVKVVAADQTAIASLKAENNTKDNQIEKDKTEVASINATQDEALKKAQADAAAAAAQANAALDANKAVIASLQTDAATQQKTNSDSVAAITAQLATANQQLTKANENIVQLQTRLGNRRVDVTNATIRQADGKLIRVPSNEICYINLGYGDQVTPGLTFEVYDKSEGVPPIPPNVSGDEQLPVGKASIEITHVGATSSECRIVKIEAGAVLSEGDLIENLVYDPHTKYNFFVYGNFDLGGTGRPNPADAEVMKRLVTQWGGKLTDQVNVNTDFVVLGSEPVLPTFSKDDLTAENQDKLAKAQEALDKYQELLVQAKDLHIPIMNQNRFLYYVGYYDQAKR
jgi:cell division protein FtsB